jgi:hypothetical protein
MLVILSLGPIPGQPRRIPPAFNVIGLTRAVAGFLSGIL